MASQAHKSKYYDRTKHVSSGVIEKIKQMGMGEAIKHARSGSADDEFVEGAKRMYGRRVSEGDTAGGGKEKLGPPAPKEKHGPPAPPEARPQTQPASSSRAKPSQASIGRRLTRTERDYERLYPGKKAGGGTKKKSKVERDYERLYGKK